MANTLMAFINLAISHTKRCLPNSRDIVWLAVMAMLFNALAPSALASVSNQKQMLFCTSSGYTWVDVSDIAPISSIETEAVESESTQHCLKCISSNDINTVDLEFDKLELYLHVSNQQVNYSSKRYKAALVFNTLARAPPK